jgi:RNA polymerase sigma-70 factor (ECF subfamily)
MIVEKISQLIELFQPAAGFSASLEERFHKGDMEAFEMVMRDHQNGIFGLGLRLFCDRDRAADFCQDVFIKAYEKCSRYDPRRPLKPWLFQVAANLGRDLLRKKQEIPMEDDALTELPHEADTGHGEELMVRDELKDKVWKTVGQLSAAYREVIALRFSSDLSLQEIAETLGISLSAAKVRLCRGLRAFEEVFKAQGGEEYVV